MTRHRRTGPAAALLALAAGLTACTTGEPGAPSAGAPTATATGATPVLTSASVADDVDVTAGTWSTTWTACFSSGTGDAEMDHWEVQAVTSEGTSPRIRTLDRDCVELQLAQGSGSPEGDPGRLAALSDAANLAYRARGVREDGTVTPWTDPVPAGSVR